MEETFSLIVISPQYCTTYDQVVLYDYIAERVKKITEGGHLGVFDINGNNIFEVKTNGFFSSRLALVDAAGVPVASFKPVKFSFAGKWKVYRGDSSDPKDLLFSVKRSNFFQFNSQLDVFLASNTDEYACDFTITQNFSGKNCVIRRGNSGLIAEMHKNKAVRDKVRWKDTFSVSLCPNVAYAFAIAMRVVLNEYNTPNNSGGADGGGGGGGGCGGGG